MKPLVTLVKSKMEKNTPDILEQFAIFSFNHQASQRFSSDPPEKNDELEVSEAINYVKSAILIHSKYNVYTVYNHAWTFQRMPNGSYRVSIHHPLGFNWHPLEGAGVEDIFLHISWGATHCRVQQI